MTAAPTDCAELCSRVHSSSLALRELTLHVFLYVLAGPFDENPGSHVQSIREATAQISTVAGAV